MRQPWGRLDLCGGQSYAGALDIEQGTVGAVDSLPNGYFQSLGGLSLHVDASVPESLETDDDGSVRKWYSAVGAISDCALLGGGEATFSGSFAHVNPLLITDENGHAAVRMGREADGTTFRATLLKPNTTSGLMGARTIFLVQTQRGTDTHITAGYGLGIVGYGSDYKPYRIYRNPSSPYAFIKADSYFTMMEDAWVNGRKSVAADDVTFEASGVTKPNLLVVRNEDYKSFEVIGGQYLNDNNRQWGSFDLHEAIFFDTALTDEQIEKISAYLIRKWDVPAQAAVPATTGLSPASAITVAAGATADFGSCTQTVSGVTGGGTVAFTGMLDLNGGVIAASALTGGGTLTNTSATASTITFATATDVTLQTRLAGNVNLVKSGAGALTVAPGLAAYTGQTRLEGGSLVPSFAIYCASLGGLQAHVDAAAAGTVTVNADGEMTAWASVGGTGKTFAGGDELSYDSSILASHKNPLFLTNGNGHASVRFGREANGTTVRKTVMKYASENITARTYFFVQTQIDTSKSSYGLGLLGNFKNYTFRMYRNATVFDRWIKSDVYNQKMMEECWQNGRKATSNDDCSFEASGVSKPNLLVVRNSAVNSFEIIGGQYLQDSVRELKDRQWGSFDLHEMILFDTALTDAEIEKISSYLMKKWDVPTQNASLAEFTNPLPAGEWVVAGNASLILSGFSQEIDKLVCDAQGTGVLPLLTVDGSIDVTETDLEFVNAAGIRNGAFLRTSGALTSPFASVTGAEATEIRYTETEAKFRKRLGMIIEVH